MPIITEERWRVLPQLAKTQRAVIVGSPASDDTYTAQLLALRLREHYERGEERL